MICLGTNLIVGPNVSTLLSARIQRNIKAFWFFVQPPLTGIAVYLASLGKLVQPFLQQRVVVRASM